MRYDSWRTPEEHEQWIEHQRYMADWQICDFYKYNPLHDNTKHMNYTQYYNGRKDGSIPAPNHDEVVYNITHPIHVQQQDGV